MCVVKLMASKRWWYTKGFHQAGSSLLEPGLLLSLWHLP